MDDYEVFNNIVTLTEKFDVKLYSRCANIDDKIDDGFAALSTCMTYLLFDAEAANRELEILKKMKGV